MHSISRFVYFRVLSLRPFCTTIWSVKLRESRDFWHLYENIYRWLDVKSLKSLKVIKNSAGYHHWHVELISQWFSSKAISFIKPFWPIRSKRCSRMWREFNCISLEILRMKCFHNFFSRQQMFTEKLRLNQFSKYKTFFSFNSPVPIVPSGDIGCLNGY